MTPALLPDDHPIVLFDGVCNFCEASIQFIIKRDTDAVFRFASLQGEQGRAIALKHGVDPDIVITLMLLEEGTLYNKSCASLRIARHLRFPWNLARVFLILPKWMRDPFYMLVSKNRYRIAGKKEECMVPGPELRERFL